MFPLLAVALMQVLLLLLLLAGGLMVAFNAHPRTEGIAPARSRLPDGAQALEVGPQAERIHLPRGLLLASCRG